MSDNSNLINEENIPGNWEPVESNPIVPGAAPKGAPAPPVPHDMPQFFSGSMPPALQHDVAFVGTEVGTPRIPKYSLMPFGNQSSPFTNAAAQSTAIKVVETTPSSGGGGGSSSIELIIPSIFTPVDQTVVLPGPLAFALATELPGTYLGVPSGAGLGALEAFNVVSNLTGAGGSATVTVTSTPSTATSWALLPIVTKNGYAGAGLGAWTGITGNDGLKGTFIKNIAGTSPVSVSEPLIANDTATLALAIFSGPLPTIVQQNTASSWTGQTMSKAYGSSNTAGNTLFIIFQYTLSSTAFGVSASDTAGNSYVTLASTFGGSTAIGATAQLIMIAPACLGGANTVNVKVTGGSGATPTGLLQIFEIAPIAAGAGVPFFHPLFPGDIPPINLSSVGNGGIQNILGLANGGTKSDLSGTGGVHQFVSQASAGAALTVVQPDFSDLAGAAGQKATSYNGVALVANGLVSETAQADLTGQTAAKATTTLYAVPTTAQYRLSWNAKVTTVDPGSSTLGALTITYTDADNTVQTIVMSAQDATGANVTTNTGNLTTSVLLGNTHMLNCRSGTNIQYAFAYASGTPATMAYNLHLKLESL
jgi:hypothetical protein